MGTEIRSKEYKRLAGSFLVRHRISIPFACSEFSV